MKKIMKTILNPDKGQHLLLNEEIADREISEANLGKNDRVIEIGAGSGILTEKLMKKAKSVLAFEIDRKFEAELKKIESKNLNIIYDDALKHSWKGYNKIVSNIPYYLSGDVIIKAARDNIEMLVLIVGEDFKKKLERKEGIGVFSDVFYEFNPIAEIDRTCFSPFPKVNSWLITLKRKKEDLLQRIIVKKGKLKNSIMHSLVEIGRTKNQAREMIKQMNILENVLEKFDDKITGEIIIKLKEKLLI